MRKSVVFCVLFAIIVCLAVGLFVNNARKETYQVLFTKEVEAASLEFGVDSSLIYAVIKCESDFDPSAVSSAGAIGLMQLMPATFDEMAWRLKESPDVSAVYEPTTAIRYGTFYLKYLIDYFGSEETAVAAYNAGMGRVKAWLENSEYSDDGVTLKTIPIKETRSYVNRVMKVKNKYREITEVTSDE